MIFLKFLEISHTEEIDNFRDHDIYTKLFKPN